MKQQLPLPSTLLLLLLLTTPLSAQHPSTGLPRATPESQAVSSQAITDFLHAADQDVDSLHSFMLLRHGKVIAEAWWSPYDPKTKHQLYSLSKSFTSTAVGLAIHEGKLNLDDEVIKFFPNDLPEAPSNHLKSMRIRDLLAMSTGHDAEPWFVGEPSWSKKFLAHPVKFKPGTHFLYNTPATYMCSVILQKQTGQKVIDFLRPRLFDPLGIENPSWDDSPEGVTLGGYGLSIRTEDIAKFGQLYLQKGQWNGQQLVPADWIALATAKQTSNGSNPNSDWDQGYGFQFWRCRHNFYRGDGAFGQYCIVMPDLDAVLAITGGLPDMQAVLNLAWTKLLPGFQANPLPENPSLQQTLQQISQSLSLRTVKPASPPLPPSSRIGQSYQFDSNPQLFEQVSLTRENNSDSCENNIDTLVCTLHGKPYPIPIGQPKWTRRAGEWGSNASTQLATSAAWTAPNECTVKLCYLETPFIQTLRFQFSDDELQLHIQTNVCFGPNQPTKLQAKRITNTPPANPQ